MNLKTRAGAGQLAARLVIPLAAYAGEPVSVRLDDGDSNPIVRRVLQTLPPSGNTGRRFRFFSKLPGLQVVRLRDLSPSRPGSFQLNVKARQWFTAAEANDTAANTLLTVTIGSQCASHVVTRKID